jgi:hypothetical protein
VGGQGQEVGGGAGKAYCAGPAEYIEDRNVL